MKALLNKVRDILGSENVVVDADELANAVKSISEHRPREIAAIFKPQNCEHVQYITEQLNQMMTPPALYPLSTGKNWGYGSKNPVKDGCILLDMSQMTQIHHLDLETGVAVIEPGVSQGQLIDAIAGSNFKLNVTNSARQTSIIGNALERGIGTLRHRSEDIIGYEVVLGNGKRIQTGGLWPTTSKYDLAFHYSHGIGPNLSGLFSQSNFGIVTKAAVSLIPKSNVCSIIKSTFSSEHLLDVYRFIRSLYDQNILNTYFKIYDISAAKNYGLEKSVDDDYILYGSIETSHAFSPILEPFLLSRFEESQLFNTASIVHEQDKAEDEIPTGAEEIIHETFQGKNNITHYLQNLFSVQNFDDIDTQGYDGWLFFVPIIPADPKLLQQCVNILHDFRQQTPYLISLSIKCPKEKSIDLNVSIRFPRSKPDITQAHSLQQGLMDAFKELGILNYRYGIEHTNQKLFHDPTYREVLTKLKYLFDPNNIVAPGRYIQHPEEYNR